MPDILFVAILWFLVGFIGALIKWQADGKPRIIETVYTEDGYGCIATTTTKTYYILWLVSQSFIGFLYLIEIIRICNAKLTVEVKDS